MEKSEFSIQPIGILKTSYEQKFGTPRQGELAPSSRGQLILARRFWDQGFFSGIEGFSHIWLVSLFHLNVGQKVNGKVTPPRLENPVGVFASRAPHRPNPIGLSLVKLIEAKANEITVSGVDLIDGTPIFDIKPYIPEDQVNSAQFGWIENIKPSAIEVKWSLPTKSQQKMTTRQEQMVEETLATNPLPLVYREMENKKYWLRVEGFDVCFVSTPSGFEILEVKLLNPESTQFEQEQRALL